jgi:hypothetical protein
MRFNRHGAALLGVAVAAWLAGRAGVPAGAPAAAQDQAGADAIPPGMQARIDAGTPGPHHRVLDELIGTWDVEFTARGGPDAPPVESRGTITRRWVLDGRFVEERLEAEGPAGTFGGLGHVGFNNLDGLYELAWMDTTSTAITFETGTYHPDTKLLHMRRSQRDPVSGRVINGWSKLDLNDPDRHLYTAYATTAGGRTYKAVEGAAQRRK